jgi:hypothetical protein
MKHSIVSLMERNSDFASGIARALEARGLGKDIALKVVFKARFYAPWR